jgi:hypothetical protein
MSPAKIQLKTAVLAFFGQQETEFLLLQSSIRHAVQRVSADLPSTTESKAG